MKPKPDRQLIRLAMTIAEQLGRRRGAEALLLPEATWQDCRRINHQLRRASERGWHRAARRLRDDLRLALNEMRDELAVAAESAEADGRQRWSASAQDIYRDLLALRGEFVDFSIELRNRLLSVSTAPIVLEGLDLGPFKIELDWSELPDGEEYRLIALDPQPAATNEGVTHPHVQDESLCADRGDARRAYPDHDWGCLRVWAWGGSVTINWLSTLPEVDMTKIVCTGHSRGGQTAALMGMMDERVAVVAPNSGGSITTGCHRVGNKSRSIKDKMVRSQAKVT